MDIKNPAVTFCVTKLDPNGVSFEYKLIIHRNDGGQSESRGTVLVGEDLHISKEELAGNEELEETRCSCRCHCHVSGNLEGVNQCFASTDKEGSSCSYCSSICPRS